MLQQFDFWVYTQLKAESQRDGCKLMFIAASLFTTAKRWKQPKYTSKNKEITKMWYKLKMEYCTIFQRKGNLTCATTQMNLEDNAKWSKPDTKVQILYDSFIWGQIHETESRPVSARGLGVGNMRSYCLIHYADGWQVMVVQQHECT